MQTRYLINRYTKVYNKEYYIYYEYVREYVWDKYKFKKPCRKGKLKHEHYNVTRSGRVQTHDGCQCHSWNTCFAYVGTTERDQCLSTIQPTNYRHRRRCLCRLRHFIEMWIFNLISAGSGAYVIDYFCLLKRWKQIL